MGKKQIDARALILSYIPERVGIPVMSFDYWVSCRLNKQAERMRDYRLLDSPMPGAWRFDDLFSAADGAVKDHFQNDRLNAAERVRGERWWESHRTEIKEDCRLFFLDLDSTEQIEDYPSAIQSLAKSTERILIDFQEIFLHLTKRQAYKLQRDLPAYASVTARDLDFVGAMLSMRPNQRRELKTMLTGQEHDSMETILERTESGEWGHWVNVRNKKYTETSKDNSVAGSWVSFCKQYQSRYMLQCPLITVFLMETLIAPGEGETVRIDKTRFGPAEIDLFLMFKYFLTEGGRGAVLDWLKARTEKGPGQ